MTRNGATTRAWSFQALGVAVVAAYVLAVQRAGGSDYDTWAGLVVVPFLVLLTVHLVFRVTEDQEMRWLRTLLLWAFALKALGAVARYVMAFVLYDGVADSSGYHGHGERLGQSYREGDFGADIERPLIGTGFIRVVTGVLYAFTGPSIFVGYAFFTWLSFWGLYFFYQAFRAGVPTGDQKRYAVLVLFLPSMLFWPSSLGKDAWMTFTIGLAMLGAARLLTWRSGWLVPFVAGLGGTALVRPPITAALFGALVVAWVFRKRLRPSTSLTPITMAVTAGALVVAGLFVVNQAAAFMHVDDLSASGVQEATGTTTKNTSQGGSEFDAQPVESPLDMPFAAVSVLTRPFIFEANSAQTLIAGLEGTVLLFLMVRSVPRMRGLLRRMREEPYLILSSTYILLFVYGYSSMSNFGILTRQRVQVLPFLLVFLALPLVKERVRVRTEQRTHQELSL